MFLYVYELSGSRATLKSKEKGVSGMISQYRRDDVYVFSPSIIGKEIIITI